MPAPTIKELVEKNLFELLEIEDASDEYKQKLLKTMTRTVDARVVNRVAELLSDEDAETFAHLAEAGESEKIVQLLVDKGIDLPEIVVNEATLLRTEIVTLMGLLLEKYRPEDLDGNQT